MNLFVVITNPSKHQIDSLEAELRVAADDYPSLAGQTVHSQLLGAGELLVGWVIPSSEKAGPREYVYRDPSQIVLFTGLPVDPLDRIRAHRASELSARWNEVAGTLDGFHALIRLRNDPASLDIHTDLLGFEHIFYGNWENRGTFSNSASLIERLNSRSRLDATSVSLFVSAGWICGDRTLLEDLKALPGSLRVSWRSGQRDMEFQETGKSPNDLARTRSGFSQTDAEDLAEELLRPLSVLGKHFPVLDAPLTGGRDSRVLFSLLNSGNIPARYYTFGQNYGEDAQLAAQIVKRRGLQHEFLETSASSLMNRWEELTEKAVRRADGMFPLQMLLGLLTAEEYSGDSIPVRIWGAGGGIAKGPLQPARFSRLWRTPDGVRTVLFNNTLNARQGLIRPQGRELAEEYLGKRISFYLDQGFPASTVPDVLYTHDKVGREGGKIMRATTDARDSYSPYCSRAFLAASFSLPPRLKLTHPIHRALISHLAPDLLDIPFDFKSPGWRPKQAWRILAKGSYRYYDRKIRRVLGLRRNTKANFIVSNDMFDRRHWLEHHLARVRECTLALEDSPIWDVIDRQRFAKLMKSSTDASQRMRAAKGIYHIWTIAEYEHNR